MFCWSWVAAVPCLTQVSPTPAVLYPAHCTHYWLLWLMWHLTPWPLLAWGQMLSLKFTSPAPNGKMSIAPVYQRIWVIGCWIFFLTVNCRLTWKWTWLWLLENPEHDWFFVFQRLVRCQSWRWVYCPRLEVGRRTLMDVVGASLGPGHSRGTNSTDQCQY